MVSYPESDAVNGIIQNGDISDQQRLEELEKLQQYYQTLIDNKYGNPALEPIPEGTPNDSVT